MNNINDKDAAMEAVRNEVNELVREVKANAPEGVDNAERLAKDSANLVQTYTQLHKDLSMNQTVRDRMPSKFYDMPKSKQEGVSSLMKTFTSINDQFMIQYGDDLLPGVARLGAIMDNLTSPMKEPVRVAVTGANGAIGYALLFRIASGAMFGPHTPVHLNLLEIPAAVKTLEGAVMELRDCAFPLLRNIVITDNAEKAFEGVDYALLVGAQPRVDGMERGDLLLKNAEIFSAQGKALNRTAKGADTRVVVVGNPANTNALIAQRNAPNIPPQNFSAMTRLDHNRGLSYLAEKVKCKVEDISRFIIWGNHSSTQFPDITHALIKNSPAINVVNDQKWVESDFIPTVATRGAAIMKARGKSSAASAASSLVDAVYDWHNGTASAWTSAAVCSNGEYGVEAGLFYSYPVVYNEHKTWEIVKNLPINEFAAARMEATHKELLSERDGVSKHIPN